MTKTEALGPPKFGESRMVNFGGTMRRVSYTQTGFCGLGNHEGQKNLAPNGAVLRSCFIGGRTDAGRVGIIVCMCTCHEMTREMESLTGIEVPPVLINRTTPSLDRLLRESIVGTGRPGAPGSVDVGRPSVVLPSGARFVATPTGRAAKGQLEEQVRHFVSVQVHGAGDDMIAILGLQPGTIAKGIDAENPPSTGAVYSVLKRWERQALVELREKPFAFVKFTDRGKRELYRAPR